MPKKTEDKNKEKSYKDLMYELFNGRKAALESCSRVRHCWYEIGEIYARRGVPLNCVMASEKRYFQNKFLGGIRIEDATSAEFDDALTRLRYAVGKDDNCGCYRRCYALIEEINSRLEERGLERINDIDLFLDWLTFYHENPDGKKEEVYDPDIHGPVWLFKDSLNRKLFWAEAQIAIKAGMMMSLKDIAKIVAFKRSHSRSL